MMVGGAQIPIFWILLPPISSADRFLHTHRAMGVPKSMGIGMTITAWETMGLPGIPRLQSIRHRQQPPPIPSKEKLSSTVQMHAIGLFTTMDEIDIRYSSDDGANW